jgi:hypothetical protein
MTGPSTEIVTNGHIASVSWSHNGDQLWAGGKYDNNGYNPILGWQDAKGEPIGIDFPVVTASINTHAIFSA